MSKYNIRCDFECQNWILNVKTKIEKRKTNNEKRKANNEKRKTKNKPTSHCYFFFFIIWGGGGHHNIGLYLGVIFMHFRVFFKVKVQNREYFFSC